MMPTIDQEQAINSAQGAFPRLLTRFFPEKDLRKRVKDYINSTPYSQNPDKIGIFSIIYKPWDPGHKEMGGNIIVQLMIPKELLKDYEQLTGRVIDQNKNLKRFVRASKIIDLLEIKEAEGMRIEEIRYRDQIGFMKDPRTIIEVKGQVRDFPATPQFL